MRSKALNGAFNRALTDPYYRQRLFHDLRGVLQHAGVPEREIRLLEARAPRSLEALTESLETLHTNLPGR